MQSQTSSEQVASALLTSRNLHLKSCKVIQQLWAGYGHICRLEAVGLSNEAEPESLILKYISPPETSENAPIDEGHVRKILSYQIEQYFYIHLAPLMPDNVAVASCFAGIDSASSSSDNTTAMIMSDLKLTFPIAGDKRSKLSKVQTYAALDWLGNFHGFWWDKVQAFDRQTLCRPPLEHVEKYKSTSLAEPGVWLNGGYTYLATRRTEYASLCSDKLSEWSPSLCTPVEKDKPTIAELVANFLSPSSTIASRPCADFQTLIHGDVKSENLFTTTDGTKVAFFDFQYVGLGLGVCDLAKLCTCSVPLVMLTDGDAHPMEKAMMNEKEETILRRYISTIETISGKKYSWNIFVRHWETALVDWLRFQASWGFWGNTQWLEARVRSILDDSGWKEWLLENTA